MKKTKMITLRITQEQHEQLRKQYKIFKSYFNDLTYSGFLRYMLTLGLEGHF